MRVPILLSLSLLACADSGAPPLPAPDCIGCVADGDTCLFSINCAIGSICNNADDEYFRPNDPLDRCVRVTCQSNEECRGGEICNLIGICRPEACQSSDECPVDERCVAGACVPPQPASAITGCKLIAEPPLIVRDQQTKLTVLAFDRDEEVVPEVEAELQSDNPDAVRISGRSATGALRQGEARIVARIGAVSCSAMVVNLVPVPPDVARVTAVAAEDGHPIAGARVELRFEDGSVLTSTTGAFGATPPYFTRLRALWVTVFAVGREITTVFMPGKDVVLPLSRAPRALAGGSRGYVRIDQQKRDIFLALTGHAAPLDLFSLPVSVNRWFCSSAPAPVSLAELGLDDTPINFPEGMVVGLGNNVPTEEPELRCKNLTSPGDGAAGCYLATGDMSSSALFSFGGRISVGKFLSRYEDSVPGCRTDVGGLFSLFSILSEGRHGAAAYEELEEAPLLCSGDQCRPDYVSFGRRDLLLASRLELMSAVRVPKTAIDGSSCHDRMLLLAGARLPGRGFLPVGFAAAGESSGCRVSSGRSAIGDRTPQLPPSVLPLVAAPLSSGTEGAERSLVAFSLSRTALGTNETALSVLHQKIDRLSLSTTLRGSFLAVPNVRRTRSLLDLDFDSASVDSTLRRVRFLGADGAWTVYLPAEVASVILPEIAGTTSFAVEPAFLEVSELRVAAPYDSVWRSSENAGVHRLFEQPAAALALRRCAGALRDCAR